MTQRYFGILFILVFTAVYIGLTYIIDEVKLSQFIVVFVMCGYYAGQYSTRFKKE